MQTPKQLLQLVVVLTLVATFFTATCFAQQDGKTLLQECLQAQAQEFQPLAQQRDAAYQEFANRSTSIRSILRWLDEDYKTADARRIREIAALESRLKALKENANLTAPEATKDVAATVEAANVMLEDIDDERDIAIKPFSRKLSALQRKYKPQETTLKPFMLDVFREKGDSESTESLTKSYGSFNYSSGTSSATYKQPGDNKSAAICYIYLVNEKVGKEKFGLFNDKYPVAYRSQNQLEILVGQTRVTIYSSHKDLGDSKLDATLTSLVNIEKLESMLGL